MTALETCCPVCDSPPGWPCQEGDHLLQTYPHRERHIRARHTTARAPIWADLLASSLAMAGFLSVRTMTNGRRA